MQISSLQKRPIMICKIKKISLLCLYLLGFQNAFAIRIDNDATLTPHTTSIKIALEQRLLEIIPMQKVNYEKLNLSLERAKSQQIDSSNKDKIVLSALEIQFQELILLFNSDIQTLLIQNWNDNSWLVYSDRAEHSFKSSPLGELRFIGENQFHLTLDKQLLELPILTKLIKMLALTHIMGPQLTVLRSESLAFYQQTYATQELLSMTSAYWALLQWLDLSQVEKVIALEIRTSKLEIRQIRNFLDLIKEVHNNELVASLNVYIKTQHTMFLNKHLTNYLQKWLNESLNEYVFTKPKIQELRSTTAQIFQFKPRTKTLEPIKCSSVIVD